MILQAAARLATVEGLDGLTIGRLAAETGMSKSGLFAHFGSKEELQLATIGRAEEIFEEDVLEPALAWRASPARRGALRALPLARRAQGLPRRLLLRVGRRRAGHPPGPRARPGASRVYGEWTASSRTPSRPLRTAARSGRRRSRPARVREARCSPGQRLHMLDP